MSLFSIKSAQTAVQPWLSTLVTGKVAPNVPGVFDLYDSLGNVTINTDSQIPSVLDGPMAVRRYNNLTIDAATANVTLTTQNRCRGLLLLIDGNLTLQRTGSYVASISMTARGARGHAMMGNYDVLIPDSIQLQGKNVLQREVLQFLKTNGYAVIDRWMWDEWGKYLGVSATAWTGGTVLLSASGCGAGALNSYANGTSPGNQATGYSGSAGTNGGVGGGGGGGAAYALYHGGKGGAGRPWGGGSGGSAQAHNYSSQLFPNGFTLNADEYGGAGGDGGLYTGDSWTSLNGAGNPAGRLVGVDPYATPAQSGTGGVLIIVCKGSITVNAGCIIQADGVQGGYPSTNQYKFGGGSSGGGNVSIISSAAPTNNGTLRANGGASAAGTTGGANGGAGGAGSVVTKTFAQMGWS